MAKQTTSVPLRKATPDEQRLLDDMESAAAAAEGAASTAEDYASAVATGIETTHGAVETRPESASFTNIVGDSVSASEGDTVWVLDEARAVRYDPSDSDADSNGYVGLAGAMATRRALQTFDSELIGHRGLSGLAPENTLVACTTAFAHGADSVEVDARMSSDGEWVLMHDPEVDRTTDGTGDVENMTLSELKALDAGSWFDARFAGARVPTVEEVLEVARKAKTRRVHVEIKNGNSYGDDDIESLVTIIQDAGLQGQVILGSFSETALGRVRLFTRQIPVAYQAQDKDDFEDYVSLASQAAPSLIGCPASIVTTDPQLVTLARSQGIDVRCSEVDSSSVAQELAAVGVSRFMSNHLFGAQV